MGKRKTKNKPKLIAVLFIFIILVICVYFLFIKLNFSLKGGNSITIAYGQEFIDPGFNASKGIIKFNNVTVSGSVDTNNIGVYTLTYTAKTKHKTKTIIRTVNVADLTGPVINAPDSVDAFKGYSVSDIKITYTAVDFFDGDCSSLVKRDDKQDHIILTATDKKGNVSQKKISINFIEDTAAPIIDLNGDRCIIINPGQSYIDQGCTAFDDRDGDITSLVKATQLTDISKVGTYKITYTVSDKGGNSTKEIRYIIVAEKPVITDPSHKVIYLTFDDGPSPNTKYVLDILQKYNVKATFFVTNQHSESIPILSRIKKEGHTIAAHTYSHKYEDFYKSTDDYFADLNKINNIIAEYTGSPSKFVRFPGGSSNLISAKYKKGIMSEIAAKCYEKGYTYFDWHIDCLDTTTTNPNKIVDHVTSSLGTGYYNILLHDTKTVHRTALPKIIEYALENGYTFLPITDGSPAPHHSIKN